jgi:hypothetical protein
MASLSGAGRRVRITREKRKAAQHGRGRRGLLCGHRRKRGARRRRVEQGNVGRAKEFAIKAAFSEQALVEHAFERSVDFCLAAGARYNKMLTACLWVIIWFLRLVRRAVHPPCSRMT